MLEVITVNCISDLFTYLYRNFKQDKPWQQLVYYLFILLDFCRWLTRMLCCLKESGLISLPIATAAVILFLLKICSYSLYVCICTSNLSGIKYANHFLLPFWIAMVNHIIGAPFVLPFLWLWYMSFQDKPTQNQLLRNWKLRVFHLGLTQLSVQG